MIKNKSRGYPTTLTFDITYKCNLRCRMCNVWKLDERSDKPELTTKEIIDTFKTYKSHFGVNCVRFLGGEPLLREDLPEIIREISPSAFTEIVTNGTLINESVAKELVKGELHRIRFSIDGPEKYHDLMRGKGAFLEASKGIDALQKEKKKQNKQHPVVSIWPVMSKKNYIHLKEMYLFAKEKNADFKLLFLVDFNKSLKDTYFEGKRIGCHRAIDPDCLLLTLKEKEEIWSRYYYLLRTYKEKTNRNVLFIKIEQCLRYLLNKLCPLLYRDCNRTKTTILIDPWGNFFPCEFLYYYEYGNCLVDGPEIWFSERRVKLRKEIKRGSLPSCRECNRLGFYREVVFLLFQRFFQK